KASQQKIENLIQDLPLNKQIKRAEFILAATVAVKCLSFSLMDTLTPIISKIFPDSKIAKQLSLKRTKTTAVIHSLSTVLLEELNEKLMKPGSFFSIIMDESTDVNNIKQCAFSVIYYDDKTAKIQTNFFDMVETDSATAEDLYSLLIKVITDKNIPLKNFVGFASDTANNMAGDNLSVFALLKKELPDIVTTKCSCHMIHLVASKACLKLSNSAEELLRNLAAYFHRSYKRIKRIRRISRVLRNRVLEQYTPVHVYLQGELTDKSPPMLLSMVKTMDNRFTYVTLQFLSYALELFTDFNRLFQSEKPLLHKVKPEVEKLMKNICSNYIDITHIRRNDIMKLNHQDPHKYVPLNEVYVGTEVNKNLEQLLTEKPSLKLEVDEFRKKVLSFYIEAVTVLKQKFDFKDKIYEFLDLLDPKVARTFNIKSFDFVLKRFPVLNEYVTLQQLDNEWKEHALLNLEDYNIDINSTAEIYWQQIFKLTNPVGEMKFKNLKIVINFLLVLPFSNVSVERIFSDLKIIKTDHRNCLSSKTLKSVVATKNLLSKNDSILDFEPSEKILSCTGSSSS
ncbi:Similar to ZBED9: SCAN domain-containing protein 3 (Homo sapiens), partial [Cotesia congregata]